MREGQWKDIKKTETNIERESEKKRERESVNAFPSLRVHWGRVSC